MEQENLNTEETAQLGIDATMKRSLIEEWKGIKILGCGRYRINREERAKMQKRYLEINRILLSEYK